jgi:hypothetical protein
MIGAGFLISGEYRARVYPVLRGGGRTFFPQREHRVNLELIESERSLQPRGH